MTDIPGAVLARISGVVAAYNWVVLLSFPLSAAAAYLLARYLTLSPAAATVAAIAYAFSPFHLAQAAYHPHIAQTHWVPLYLLALWRCLDRASAAAIAFLVAATLALVFSNFYAGFIAAVVTPVAIVAYWLVTRRTDSGSTRRLGITVATIALIAAAGMAYASYGARDLIGHRAAFAFPRADLFRYSAKWWSYLVPPVEHPLFGPAAQRLWNAVDVHEGLLEQQVSLGWGIVTLGLIAIFAWLSRNRRSAALARVPVLAAVAVTALVCSLSPERTIGAFTFVRPSALLYAVAPMFRSYARFGVVVQLMAALLAGTGLDWLRRTATTGARIASVALVLVAAADYAVSPSALWRDVLPTPAHRWVMQQVNPMKVLDCTPLDQESASVQWLTGSRLTLLSGAISDCAEPDLPHKLAANGYTHLLMRRGIAERAGFADRALPDGLRLAAQFDDGRIFAVTADLPAVYAANMSGFSPREHDPAWSWRWMGADAAWTIVNTGTRPIVTTLEIELSAFQRSRRIDLRLDGRSMQALVVEPMRRTYQIGPLSVPPGEHEFMFHPAEAPSVADDVLHNGDARPLSIAIGTWAWIVRDDQP